MREKLIKRYISLHSRIQFSLQQHIGEVALFKRPVLLFLPKKVVASFLSPAPYKLPLHPAERVHCSCQLQSLAQGLYLFGRVVKPLLEMVLQGIGAIALWPPPH